MRQRRVELALQGEHPHLRPVAMSDDEVMGSSQRRERGNSDADVSFLYFGVWFLASFEQGVAA
jgi:hypothetical protein